MRGNRVDSYEFEVMLGSQVCKSSVRQGLATGVRGSTPSYERVNRGCYKLHAVDFAPNSEMM